MSVEREARREKTIEGIRYELLSDDFQGGQGLIVRWPDGYVLIQGPYITEEGYDVGVNEALFEDEAALVDFANARHSARPPSVVSQGD